MRIIVFILVCSIHCSYIPYQAHGFNDLNYFIQLLKKGVDYFKMDVSSVVEESCIHYSSWKQNQNQCEIFQNGFNICCLGFRGDTSSIPIFKQSFNTTQDFLDLLVDRQNLFKEKKRVIVINFQQVDPFSQLAKQFLYDYFQIKNRYDLQIDLFTGSDKFILDYLDKCRLGQCDEQEQYIVEQPFYLQTGAYTLQSDRYRNFNVFYQTIEDYCKNGFPNWITKYDYPIIFWEPSHEYQIQYNRKWLEDPNCRLPDSLRNIEKWRLSSNLEPEMVQIYWKQFVEYSDDILQEINMKDQKIIIPGDHWDNNIDHCKYCSYLFVGLNNDKESNIYVYEDQTNRIKTKILIGFHIIYLRSQKNMLLVSGYEQALLYWLDEDCEIHLKKTIDLKESKLIALSHNTNELVYMNLDYENKIIQLQFRDIDTDQLNGMLEQDMESYITKIPFSISFDIHHSVHNDKYYLVMAFTKYSLDLNKNLKYEKRPFKKVFLCMAEISSDYKVLRYQGAINHIDMGTIHDVKLYEFNNKIYLLGVQSDGLCQSAILLNNNDWNKCTFEEDSSYQAMSNVEFMINYFWGEFDIIWNRIENGVRINGCDTEVMHAKLMNGANPSITLRMRSDGQLIAYLLSDFIHYNSQGVFTQLFCGSSNDIPYHDQAAILATFDLVAPNQL